MNRAHEEQASRSGPVVRAAVVLLLLLLVTAGFQSWRDLAAARDLKASLQSDIADTEESILILQDRLQRIEKDPSTLEQLAREELGWVSEDDIVIVMPRDGEAGEASDGEGGAAADSVTLP